MVLRIGTNIAIEDRALIFIMGTLQRLCAPPLSIEKLKEGKKSLMRARPGWSSKLKHYFNRYNKQ
nr:MAG TPA: hypothetical protein [Caudoviricetes sp.]